MSKHIQIRNNKKLVISALIVAAVSIVAALSATIALYVNANETPQPTSIGMKDAQALPESGTCLANNPSVKTEVQAQKSLGEDDGFWTSYIYDVPAGTNVEVRIATYNGRDMITGSLAYSNQYGSYNFTASKQTDGWRYIKFTRCQ